LGRRISKTVRDTNGTTATTHYGWDGDRIVREETDNQRTTVVYEPGSFVPMLRIDETQSEQGDEKRLSAYLTDALGTPMQLVTPNGETKWQAQPDDWAAVKNQRGSTAQPIRFQGQWHDEESGLYYNRHRYYDPQQGRYISQDPIGLKGGNNLYGYVTNPTGMVDPLGLSWEAIRKIGQAALVVREKAWCAASEMILGSSRSQLPGILEEEMEAARQSRASGIGQCARESESREALGFPDEVVEGEFNLCREGVDREYKERVEELSRRNASRHKAIDDGLGGIIKECVVEPSIGDFHFPEKPSRSR
ncbi:RHS domain-containing protein, partial [Halomonas sp. ANAO-440]|uniref:RHS repeat-associated core domain-containing protein n=1 Tax=Halomonas sp. ANAO-440 TaxID=2861360 RepID=UPI001CAA4422